ncbi:MAG TPA: hypothetical protein PKK60_02175 [archaeon]|nr:hypothetical protein [archaeon]
MSVYGPKIDLPKVELPETNIDPKIIFGVIILFVLIGLLFFIMPIIGQIMNPSVKVSWTNNPLNLKENPTEPAELNLTLINTTQEMITLNLEVTTPSNEIIVFCPYTIFENVEPGKERQVKCLVRRNPDSLIFAGTYDLKVRTNLGETNTTLQVVTK